MILAGGTVPAMQAMFIDIGDPASSAAGARFAVLHTPNSSPRGLVVYAHPFTEEMNKSRRMVAMQARALAGAGYAVLLPDLLGCGDSAGDFADASWDGWINELVGACRWLRQSTLDHQHGSSGLAPLTLWGLRSGALLAAAAAAKLGDVRQLLLWQPPANGKSLLQQFLRLHSAAALAGGVERSGSSSTGALKALLSAGQAVDVGGYRLNPAVAQGLEQAQLSPASGVQHLHWLEISPREGACLGPAAASTLATWQQAGTQVHSAVVTGPAFWQTLEIEDAPALVDATLAVLAA